MCPEAAAFETPYGTVQAEWKKNPKNHHFSWL